ncbi:BTB/POZ protein [Thelonectria olida]|uniref:BTB/POZ protein n=1 Tax=Thelonectria olida TaxID=1576542 RepID=A0A9P8VSW3_9HYPO|nr:BTB/POZ protein [Thelonectria olida]
MISTRTTEQVVRYIYATNDLNSVKAHSLNRARERGEFTDLTFTCNGYSMPVHRVIVCSQSPVFRAACTGEFKEASTRTYSLDSHSLPMVRRLVDFLYTGDYTEKYEEEVAGEDPISILSVHVAMFALADKYDIEELSALSGKKYCEYLTKNPDVSNFLLSIPEIYESTPTSSRGLRDHALSFSREKLPEFLTGRASKELFDEVAADSPEFIRELLYSFIEEPLQTQCWNCGRSSKPIP